MILIFDNEAVEYDEVDFKVWLTDDGEEELIEDLSDDEVKAAYFTLKRKLKMLPEHINSEIWEEYLDIFEEECELRGIKRM